MGFFDFLKSKPSEKSITLINRWRSAYPNSQKYIYDWDVNGGYAKLPTAYKGVLTDLSLDAIELHRLSELKDVEVTTVNGIGDLWVFPFVYEVPIGETEHKTLLFFFYKNQTGLRALSINLSIDIDLTKNKEKLILLDGIGYVHYANKIKQSKLPIDILVKNTKCLLPNDLKKELDIVG